MAYPAGHDSDRSSLADTKSFAAACLVWSGKRPSQLGHRVIVPMRVSINTRLLPVGGRGDEDTKGARWMPWH